MDAVSVPNGVNAASLIRDRALALGFHAVGFARAELGAEARYPALLATFTAATRLETAFWDMGLRAGQ